MESKRIADVLLKTLNKRKGIRIATYVALEDFERHLLALGSRHLLREDIINPSYRVKTSFGEYKKGTKVARLLETTMHFEGKELSLMTHTLKEMKTFSQRIEIALKVIRKYSAGS